MLGDWKCNGAVRLDSKGFLMVAVVPDWLADTHYQKIPSGEEPREPSSSTSRKPVSQENHHPTHLRNPSAKRTTSSTIPEETCTFDSKIKKTLENRRATRTTGTTIPKQTCTLICRYKKIIMRILRSTPDSSWAISQWFFGPKIYL